ncbi:MAG: hypothetical protein H7X93_11910 [Sphingomonadaceae bacterium]|nr:hypothetical protein [Sphingomonadaceae bacterium]
MIEPGASPAAEARRDRQNRVRVGVTGLAFVFVLVALAASFTGSASDEPELTADTRAEGVIGNEVGSAAGEVSAPQDPLAEIGVAPGGTPEEETNQAAPDAGVAQSLEELDARDGSR